MPGEQCPQRGVITGRHRGDQRIVIHRFSIASHRQSVHHAGKILGALPVGVPATRTTMRV
jgi:hypothetical protein